MDLLTGYSTSFTAAATSQPARLGAAARVEASRDTGEARAGLPDMTANGQDQLALRARTSLFGPGTEPARLEATSTSSRILRFVEAVQALRLESDTPLTKAELDRLLEAARIVFMTDDGIPKEPEPDPVERARQAVGPAADDGAELARNSDAMDETLRRLPGDTGWDWGPDGRAGGAGEGEMHGTAGPGTTDHAGAPAADRTGTDPAPGGGDRAVPDAPAQAPRPPGASDG